MYCELSCFFLSHIYMFFVLTNWFSPFLCDPLKQNVWVWASSLILRFDSVAYLDRLSLEYQTLYVEHVISYICWKSKHDCTFGARARTYAFLHFHFIHLNSTHYRVVWLRISITLHSHGHVWMSSGPATCLIRLKRFLCFFFFFFSLLFIFPFYDRIRSHSYYVL